RKKWPRPTEDPGRAASFACKSTAIRPSPRCWNNPGGTPIEHPLRVEENKLEWICMGNRFPSPRPSPLNSRGEGARRAHADHVMPLAAFITTRDDESRAARRRSEETLRVQCASPSPLNGERAGVRGANFPSLTCTKRQNRISQ